jgi:hypothetical protein
VRSVERYAPAGTRIGTYWTPPAGHSVGSPPDFRVVLDGGDRDDPPRSLDMLDADLGKAHVPDLPGLALQGDDLQGLLERRLRIEPVQGVGAMVSVRSSAQALLDLGAQHLGGAGPPAGSRPWFATTQPSGTGESASPIPPRSRRPRRGAQCPGS